MECMNHIGEWFTDERISLLIAIIGAVVSLIGAGIAIYKCIETKKSLKLLVLASCLTY